MIQAAQHKDSDANRPWWRFPIVWMVIGGPLTVVVAGVLTAVIAFRNVDPVLDTSDPHAQASQKPAVQGRNLAADNAVNPAGR